MPGGEYTFPGFLWMFFMLKDSWHPEPKHLHFFRDPPRLLAPSSEGSLKFMLHQAQTDLHIRVVSLGVHH